LSRRRKSAFAWSAVLAAAGAIVFTAPVATAQQVAGSDQYQGGAGPTGGAGQGAGQDGPDGGAEAGGPSATVAESGGGSLPFTGYPITPLVLLVIALVAVGLALRLGSKARDRFRAAQPAGG
jgi:hypothetical protein